MHTGIRGSRGAVLRVLRPVKRNYGSPCYLERQLETWHNQVTRQTIFSGGRSHGAISRDIEIVEFVPQAKISQQWYERPYYAGPDGDEKEYFALVEALQNKESEGIAHWVM